METKTTQRARVNGIELGYQITGKGEPLVLLHGGFGSVEMFGSNVDLLAAKRQVIGVDLQSHGRSPAADRPMRFETMADDIAELIHSLGLERAAIMIGDADGIPPSHAVEFFELLGGGKHDAGWDRSGMTQHRLAILPGLTHYDINVAPALSAAVIPFLDGA
ncbi:MAG: alpha/beta fold hydrolase [Chloroflexi bacterium]|nr:MAG: alpha/beta fold hydrolase [Chloroflexota bacterium]